MGDDSGVLRHGFNHRDDGSGYLLGLTRMWRLPFILLALLFLASCAEQGGEVYEPKIPVDDELERLQMFVVNPGTMGWYKELWETMKLRTNNPHAARIERNVEIMIRNMDRYVAVEEETGVPWYVIGAIHGLESNFNFKTYLHNGDPLGKKTVRVPKGVGPFYDWETAAVDALRRDGFLNKSDWSIERILQRCERYNGLGYLKYHPEVKSPYLWSGTNHYLRGKYVADGRFSSTAVSAQLGAAASFKKLEELGVISLDRASL